MCLSKSGHCSIKGLCKFQVPPLCHHSLGSQSTEILRTSVSHGLYCRQYVNMSEDIEGLMGYNENSDMFFLLCS
jgi:hypothetical protein